MDALRREAELAHLQSRRRQLQRELARVEKQIIQAERKVHAAEKQIIGLSGSRRRAA